MRELPTQPSSGDPRDIESAFAAAPVGLGVIDLQGRYLRVNAELARINGLPVDAHIGHSVREVVPSLADEALRIIEHIRRTGDTVRDLELSGDTARAPGQVRDWLSGFYPVRGDDGAVRAVGVWVVDNTERRRTIDELRRREQQQREAQSALEASRLKLQMGIQAAGLMMAEIDYRTDLNHLSGELARLLALGDGPVTVPRGAIFGRLHPDDRERYMAGIAQATDPAGSGHMAINARALLPDGTVRWLHVRLQVTFTLHQGRWQPDRGICAARDVTDEVVADQRKDMFIATLAHELRNPLAPVRAGLEIIKRTPGVPPAVARTRDMMERQLTHMVRLVDDLMDVSRISRDRLVLRREPLTLQQVVGHALEASGPVIEAAGHRLALELPPQPVAIDGDLTRLAQVLGNLLHNAAKYTPAGGRITLAATVEGAEAVLRVADTGVGIPAAALPQVFELFRQDARATTQGQGGLGIGLWLVRKLVEMHGGQVRADSAGAGQGSCFTVRLPRAGATAPAGADARAPGPAA